MKKMLMVLGVFLVAGLLVGCSNVKEGAQEMKNVFDVKSEIDEYLPVREQLNNEEGEVFQEFESAFFAAEYAEDALEIVNEYIPKYEKVVKAYNEVELETEELKEVHAFYTESAEMTLETLKTYKAGYESQDEELLNQADASFQESIDIAIKGDEELLKLAEEYRVDLTLE